MMAKTEAVVFGLPAAAAATTRHDTSWIQQHGSQASVQECGQHCAGRRGAGQGAPEEAVLSRACFHALLSLKLLLFAHIHPGPL